MSNFLNLTILMATLIDIFTSGFMLGRATYTHPKSYAEEIYSHPDVPLAKQFEEELKLPNRAELARRGKELSEQNKNKIPDH